MWLTVGRAPAAYAHWQIKKTGKLPMRNDIAGSSPFALTSRPGPKNHSNSDDELIAKIAAGNRLAMQVLYARHHTRVYRFLLRLVGNDAVAEDLTSDVFLSVWRQADSRGLSASPPGCWPPRATRRSPSCAAAPRHCPRGRTRASRTRPTTRRSRCRPSIAERSCAAAWGSCRASTARSSISSTITKNPCRRSRGSSAFPAIRSRRAFYARRAVRAAGGRAM